MSIRSDISNSLIHFTKGKDMADAFENLISIISNMALIGNNGMIKGGYKCVCFSEAPLSAIKNGLVNQDYYSKYSPFGIMVSKKWLFKKGGRPVIYQKEEEYNDLSSNAWRHVTFDLSEEQLIDFTWEREWRINTDKLTIDEKVSTIVLPNNEWAHNLVDNFEWESLSLERYQYGMLFGDPMMADLMASERGHYFDWPMITLED
ncbi:hypothetical protein JYU05_01505 [bacterium AH-315-P13]|nr:hypothetical protein [bacterium AH-315-P13]